MKALINADELANDVAGAEALLDRHQEHKVGSLLIHQVKRSMNNNGRQHAPSQGESMVGRT